MGNMNSKPEVDIHTKICISAAQKLENTQVKRPSPCRPQPQVPGPCPKNTEPRSSLAKFDHFLRLPPELRIIIWSLAAPPPTTIMRGEGGIWKRTSGLPALLHACRESRLEYRYTRAENEAGGNLARAKRHPIYRLDTLPQMHQRIKQQRLFISTEIDTIFLPHIHIYSARNRPSQLKHHIHILSSISSAKDITRIAISSTNSWGQFLWDNVPELKKICPSLRNFTIVNLEPLYGTRRTDQVDGVHVKVVSEEQFLEGAGCYKGKVGGHAR